MIKKIKKLTNKITVIMVSLLLLFNSYCHADIVQEVSGGGEIENSKIGQGVKNIITDITGTLQIWIPILAVVAILVTLIKMITGDENDQQRYKKRIVFIVCCLLVSILSVTIVNLVAKYFM